MKTRLCRKERVEQQQRAGEREGVGGEILSGKVNKKKKKIGLLSGDHVHIMHK